MRWQHTVWVDLQLAAGRRSENAVHQAVVVVEQEDWQPIALIALLTPLFLPL